MGRAFFDKERRAVATANATQLKNTRACGNSFAAADARAAPLVGGGPKLTLQGGTPPKPPILRKDDLQYAYSEIISNDGYNHPVRTSRILAH